MIYLPRSGFILQTHRGFWYGLRVGVLTQRITKMIRDDPIEHAHRILPPILQLLVAVLCTCSSSFVAAQDLEPRSYFNLPVGQNFLVAAYGYSEGELNVAPGVPLEDVQLNMDTLVVGYARGLDIGGKSGKFSQAGGNSCMKGDGFFRGEFSEVDRCGWMDPRIHFSYNFFVHRQ